MINVGDSFVWGTATFKRLPDTKHPAFPSEKYQIKVTSNSQIPDLKPYTFLAEHEWFVQRGLLVV